MLIPDTAAVFPFPAASVAVPVAVCPAPSPVSDTSGPQDTTPEPAASSQTKATVTGEEYQPFPFAGVVAAPEMVGAVPSMLTVADQVEVFPAASATERPIVCVPSPETTSVAGHGVARPLPGWV